MKKMKGIRKSATIQKKISLEPETVAILEIIKERRNLSEKEIIAGALDKLLCSNGSLLRDLDEAESMEEILANADQSLFQRAAAAARAQDLSLKEFIVGAIEEKSEQVCHSDPELYLSKLGEVCAKLTTEESLRWSQKLRSSLNS